MSAVSRSSVARSGLVRRARRGVLRLARGVRSADIDPFAAVRAVDGPALVREPKVEHDPGRDGTLRLVVLLPHLDLQLMSGGPNTALNVGARVAHRGMPVLFVATQGPVRPGHAALRAHLEMLAGAPLSSADVSFISVADPVVPLRLGRSDVVMATWWPTAHVAHTTLSVTNAREFLYLIQDFEPGFYPWSTKYALALETYGFPIRAVFNESLLRDHFIQTGVGRFADDDVGRASTSFEPAVDRALFRPGRRDGVKRLLFYARPKNPRNAFELGLRALRMAVSRGAFGPDWEFHSLGGQVPELALAPGCAMRPLAWRSLADYAAVLGQADVLVSLMLSPHTSYPPLEMAATGGAVITNSFGVKTEAALRAISSRIVAAEPNVEALASAIADAARGVRSNEASGASADMTLPASWDASLEPVVDWLMAAISQIVSG